MAREGEQLITPFRRFVYSPGDGPGWLISLSKSGGSLVPWLAHVPDPCFQTLPGLPYIAQRHPHLHSIRLDHIGKLVGGKKAIFHCMSGRQARWRSEYAPQKQGTEADLTTLLILASKLEYGPLPIHGSFSYTGHGFGPYVGG